MSKTPTPEELKADQDRLDKEAATAAPAVQPSHDEEIAALKSRVSSLEEVVSMFTESVHRLEKAIHDLSNDTAHQIKRVASAVDYKMIEPKNPHEAIQRIKAEGCTLTGQALRDEARKCFPKAFPKPQPKPEASKPATPAKAKR